MIVSFPTVIGIIFIKKPKEDQRRERPGAKFSKSCLRRGFSALES
jgi:hypothetical protein